VGNAAVIDVIDAAASPQIFYKTVSDHLPIVAKWKTAGPDDDSIRHPTVYDRSPSVRLPTAGTASVVSLPGVATRVSRKQGSAGDSGRDTSDASRVLRDQEAPSTEKRAVLFRRWKGV